MLPQMMPQMMPQMSHGLQGTPFGGVPMAPPGFIGGGLPQGPSMQIHGWPMGMPMTHGSMP